MGMFFQTVTMVTKGTTHNAHEMECHADSEEQTKWIQGKQHSPHEVPSPT